MREIKFRAWDRREKRYHYFDIYTVNTELFRKEGGNLLSYSSIEQFTGLRDKNGREIYEGDTLKWDGSIVGSVSFDNAEYIVGAGVDARAMCAMPCDEVEIIGNIHESNT